MARLRVPEMAVLALALVAAPQSIVLADPPSPPTTWARPSGYPDSKDAATCVVYPLKDIGDDPTIGKWLVETIPDVIQPGTWKVTGDTKQRQISYFAPAKVLVIYHNRSTHEKVERFLEEVKKAAIVTRQVRTDRKVVRTGFSEPAPIQTPDAADSAKTGYLVPPPLQQPKHLFHLILRYEGNGAVDGNVAELIKGISGAGTPKKESDDAPTKASQLDQLFHMIVRYEGDGIIDSNVVGLFKAIQEAQKQSNTVPTPGPDSPVAGSRQSPPQVSGSSNFGSSLTAPPSTIPSVPTTSPLPRTTTPDTPTPSPLPSGTSSRVRYEYGPPILSRIPYVNRLFRTVGYSEY